MTASRNRYWTIQPNVDSFTFGQFTECIADIAESVDSIHKIWLRGQSNRPSLNRSARNISVAIRKIVLDGGGYLFKNCVEPRLHPLKHPKTGRREGLRRDELVERIEGMSISYTVGESVKENTFNAPAHEHRTVVNPLYGLHRTGKERYRLDNLFDLSVQPMKYGRWLNLKALQVGDDVLSTERILRLLANYEGAHIESNEMTRFNASLPVDVKLPDRQDELYRKGVWITFGGVSYLHVFTLLVGVYLVKMMKGTLKRYPEEISKRFHVSHLSESILQSPSRIASPTLLLEKSFNMGLLLQSSGDADNPFELVGDFGKPGITTIQIPGWQ